MRSRRHTNHHAQALRLAPAVLALCVIGAQASDGDSPQKIASDGTVHRIEVHALQTPSLAGGTQLVHVSQTPAGEVSTRVLNGTDDTNLDHAPALEIDPLSDLPIVAWRRQSSPNGETGIYLSAFDGNDWSEPVPALDLPGDDLEPQLRVRATGIHVVGAHLDKDAKTFYRISLDRSTRSPVFGPETLPTDSRSLVPPEGDSASSEPSRSGSHFAGHLPGGVAGVPGRVFIWGVRDEPAPFDYIEGFELPEEVRSLREATVGWVGERFALWFSSGHTLFYTFRDQGRWSELRLIQLDESTSETEAVHQLQEMLVRPGPDTPD